MDEAPRENLIVKHGGYRNLKSFQVSELVYDVTVRFCDRFVERRSRTYDQMVQAARSGVQNIVEGSAASGTSKKTELKLTGVARASFEELRRDFEDFLRQRGLPIWAWDDPRRRDLIARRPANADAVAAWVRDEYLRGREEALRQWEAEGGRDGRHGQNELNRQGGQEGDGQGPDGQAGETGRSGQGATPSGPAYPSVEEIAANAALALIAVACSLLDRQIAAQAAAFEKEGGFTERLYRVRTAARKNQQ